MAIALDASIALAWCLPDESSEFSRRVLLMLRDQGAVVPAVWPLEISNSLLVAERRQRLDVAGVLESVELLRELRIEVWNADLGRSLTIVRSLARSHNLSSYDASYLDLAIVSGLPLATLDARLRGAAMALGVPLVQ